MGVKHERKTGGNEGIQATLSKRIKKNHGLVNNPWLQLRFSFTAYQPSTISSGSRVCSAKRSVTARRSSRYR